MKFQHRVLFVLAAAAFLLTTVHAAFAQDPNPPSIKSNRGGWPLYRQWNKAEVDHFAKWIENIYLVKANGTSA